MAAGAFPEYSDYAIRGAEQIPKMVDKLSEALPIERLVSIVPAQRQHTFKARW